MNRRAWLWGAVAVAMVAFAANSVLARAALADSDESPGPFAVIRVVSGAVMLVVLISASRGVRSTRTTRASVVPAVLLFTYVAGFTFAYVSLGAGTGALILFGVVQLTILSVALVRGERPGPVTWTGFAVAVVGLLVLVGPGLSAPSPGGAALMAVAGVAWAGYTLLGRKNADPLLATAHNFLVAVPLAGALLVVTLVVSDPEVSARGALLAVTSGALASGLGYALWYAVLPSLSRTTSAIVQLSPAPLAALGAAMLIDEPLTARLAVSSALVLGGVGIALAAPNRIAAASTPDGSGTSKVGTGTG